jgi:hypothetical protein
MAFFFLLLLSLLLFSVTSLPQNEEQKDLKNVQFGQKRNTFKVLGKESVVVKEIIVIKNKSSILHWIHWKDALRASQELTRPHPLQGQLKDFASRRAFQGALYTQGCLGKWFF